MLQGLASSGFILLFFRYLEAYSSVAAVTVLFLWALAAYTQGRCRLWVPCIALAALGFLHLLALFISPALAYAAGCRSGALQRLSDRTGGWTVPIVIGSSIAAGALFFSLIRPNSMLPLFSPARNLPYTVVSPAHILTMVNEQLLVALPGLLALAFALALPRCSREGVSPVDRTLLRVLVVGACVSLVMWAFVNPALGNLDWDLLSMPAPAIVMAGLYFLNLRLRERSGLSHIRVALVSLSLFHTIPWIVLQQYPDRAVAALESMVERDVHNFSRGNLGIGMFMEGHREEGRRQLERTRELGVSDKPVVLRWLSRIYIEEERYGAAEQLLARTLGIIPDKRTIELVRLYRERAPRGKERTIGLLENVISVFPHPTYFGLLTEFYRAEGRDQDLERLTRHLDETIAQLERQIPERPRDGELYLRLGALYLRRGRVRSAESALERAEMLELSRLHRISVSSLQRVIAELRSGQDLVDGAIGGSDLRGDQLR